MSDSRFIIPNGHVQIADGKFQINTNPIEGLRRIYQRHKISTIIFVVIWAILFFIVFATDLLPEVKYKIIYGAPSLGILLLIVYGAVSGASGEEYAMTIQKDSIKRIEYDWVKSLNTSKIKIIYTNEAGEEESQHIMITLLGRGEKGRLDDALSVLTSEDIETSIGTYYTGSKDPDTAA